MAARSNKHALYGILAQEIAVKFATFSGVWAVAWAGSQIAQQSDDQSDIDLYVYTGGEIPPDWRREHFSASAARSEFDNRFWEPGDEWVDARTQIHVDVMYRSRHWIREQLARVLLQYQASVGYSTCFWHNVKASLVLYERDLWYTQLQAWCNRPYPEPLRRAIVAKNYPILRDTLSSYRYQLTSALARGDRVSLNHRVAALLASYFDILCALNRLPHPGEKRLLTWAEQHCEKHPPQMVEQVNALLQLVNAPVAGGLAPVDDLVVGLSDLLVKEGLL